MRLRSGVASMMCLVGPYGLSGRPRSTKYNKRVSGRTIGGFQFARRAVMRSKRNLKASNVSFGFALRRNKLAKRAKSERVVFRLLSA